MLEHNSSSDKSDGGPASRLTPVHDGMKGTESIGRPTSGSTHPMPQPRQRTSRERETRKQARTRHKERREEKKFLRRAPHLAATSQRINNMSKAWAVDSGASGHIVNPRSKEAIVGAGPAAIGLETVGGGATGQEEKMLRILALAES